ncbi:hypothetical protein C8R47DRAFT_1210323 [Mycena vitilis]|nr:hypothetical protein C8R47DRAFT_1210323 [Mycena vitilis]
MLSAVLVAVPVLYAFLLLAWHFLHWYLVGKSLGLRDLPLLKKGRLPHEKIPGTAVICGGSVGGLMTARICHDHFERVLIVEAEAWVATDEGRKLDGWDVKCQRSRVVQNHSLHACQAFLLAGLECLFPNIEEECARSSITVAPLSPKIFHLGGFPLRVPLSWFKGGIPWKNMYTSRPSFETLLRRLVLDPSAYPNIEHITGAVTDVLPDPLDHTRVSKVLVRTESGVQEFAAALVADCTGPTRAGLKWLQRNGYGYSGSYPSGKLPLDKLKISIDQKLNYSTVTFRVPQELHDRLPFPPDLQNVKPVYILLEDSTKESYDTGRRFFVLHRPDRDQVLAFVGHYGNTQVLPKNLEELKAYIRRILVIEPIPGWVFRLLDSLKEAEDTAVYSALKIPPSTYVRYHRAANLPSNWVALGDSVMTGRPVNPTFAEGCSKVFRCAIGLHNVLRAAQATSRNTLPPDFSIKFFAEEHAKTDWYWKNTRVMDYGVPTTEPAAGESLSSGSYLRWYIRQLQRLATVDDHAGWAFYCMGTGFGTPIDAFNPNIVLKILWRACVEGSR